MEEYNPLQVQRKWQDKWKSENLYNTDLDSKEDPYYNLVMFPYPSGDRLHVGHWYNFAPADSWGRYMRMQGKNVLQPMGFDSFGLPAENYAIKTGVHPTESISANVQRMIDQLSAMGAMWDWDKMVNTSSPDYYKWTQWVFLELYKNGLAEKRKAPVNWCPSCKTVLANEQVEDGKCERCKNEVNKKNLNQWFFKITNYAEQLLDHSLLDWPEKTKLMQKNWIGRSEGVNFKCKIKDFDYEFEVFDSVPQTFMAQTFTVIAAEHPMLEAMVKGTEYEKPVMEFVKKLKKKKMANKFDLEKDMEGIFIGRYVDNPYGTGDLPIWVASFVVADYGTGIVNCSAHDERDFLFAKKYGIELRPVMFPQDEVEAEKVRNLEYCYHHADDGVLVAPDKFKGRKWGEVREDIIKHIVEVGMGQPHVNYRLRDWLISRQRYWGAPIPVVYDPEGKAHAVPEEHLPWLLPTDVEFRPDGTSPLAQSEEFIKRTEEIFGEGWRPEVDTMDTFMCSSWYFLRYPCNKMEDKAFSKERIEKWGPVDMYIGGPEHACMHLLYARFITMALHDMGHVPFKEPFKQLIHQGMITKDGSKMSKSKGNVVSPDDFVEKYGSDVFRMYLMFMGPFIQGGDWNDKGINGVSRFVDKMWKVINKESEVKDAKLLEKSLHKLIKKITKDIEKFHFNTVIAALMEFTNMAMKNGIDQQSKITLVKLLAPIAPHFAEECHEKLGQNGSVFNEEWPTYNEELASDDFVTVGIQVNGKVRGEIEVAVDEEKEKALEMAKNHENVSKYLEGANIVKEIYVPGKIIGFVVK
jgi:leucyl-tRNA synthetase